jgi:peptidoglycan/LPS O-acetylase OafA/YrhL
MYRFRKANSPATVQPETPLLEGVPRRKEWPRFWYRKHLIALFGFGLTLMLTFVLYDDYKCRAEPESDCHIPSAFITHGILAPGKWTHWGVSVYITLGYPIWGLAMALLTNYAADGHGGYVTRFLSHPVFLPLARLSYTVYMIHLITITWFFARSPAPVYANQMRQIVDAIGFAVLSFAFAFFLYLFVEKPFTSLLPWCFGFEKEERRSQRTRSTQLPLQRELSFVADVDSETVIVVSPVRRSSVDLQEPLLRPPPH